MTDARAPRPAGPPPARVARPPARPALAYAAGLILPALGAAAVAAVALAVSQPPLVGVTGIGRWDAYPVFSSASLGLSIWLVTGPTVALLLAILRLALPPLAAAAVAGLAAGLGLAGLVAWRATGGEPTGLLLAEAAEWARRILPFSLGGAVWLHLLVRLSRRPPLRSAR